MLSPSPSDQDDKSASRSFLDGLKKLLDDPALGELAVLRGLYRGIQLGLVVIVAFIIEDNGLLYPDRHTEFMHCLYARLFMIGASCLFIFVTHKFFDIEDGAEMAASHREDVESIKLHSIFGLIVMQIVGIGTIYIGHIIGGSQSNYFAGVIMVFMGVAILVPISAKLLLMNMSLMIAAYVFSICWDEQRLVPSTLSLSNLSILVGGAGVSWYGSQTMTRLRAQCRPTSSEEKSPPINENKKKTGLSRNTVSLIKVFVGLIVTISGLQARVKIYNSEVADKNISLPAIRINGEVGSSDASIEFRNATRFSISLENAQVIFPVGQSIILNISTKDKQNLDIIAPEHTVRVYLTDESAKYFFEKPDQIGKAGIDYVPSSIRLVGFRIWPTSN